MFIFFLNLQICNFIFFNYIKLFIIYFILSVRENSCYIWNIVATFAIFYQNICTRNVCCECVVERTATVATNGTAAHTARMQPWYLDSFCQWLLEFGYFLGHDQLWFFKHIRPQPVKIETKGIFSSQGHNQTIYRLVFILINAIREKLRCK